MHETLLILTNQLVLKFMMTIILTIFHLQVDPLILESQAKNISLDLPSFPIQMLD